jgi:hypothetical protein
VADKVPLRSVRVGRVRGRRTRTTLLIGTNFVAVPRWGAGSEQSIMNDTDCTRKDALNVALKREQKKTCGNTTANMAACYSRTGAHIEQTTKVAN